MKTFNCLLLLLFPLLLLGQQKEDVKVGLVLSGGGAKGLAHIGALKVIEEAGIQIDYIGGTSMGAIVGALYASGYTAKQLDSLFHEINFNVLIQDEVPRSAKTFYEKEDRDRYALSFPFNDFKISFPSGLSKGQNIYNLISSLTLHLGDSRDFKKMPIPFFCVAADIETGEEVIIDSGSLPAAVSASGAIPSVFSPVKFHDRLLTDGGVINNYPVEELRKRGADVVIGVDVQDTLVSRESLKSVFDILTQIVNFETVKAMKEKKKLTDVYIKPDIRGYSLLSFEKGEAIIEAGETAARNLSGELQKLASMQSKPLRQMPKVQPVDTVQISSLTIEGKSTYPQRYLQGKLNLKYNTDYALSQLTRGINSLTATGNFERVNYNLIPNEKGYRLALQLEESPDKTFFRLGLHYDDLYKSGALLNIFRKSLLLVNDALSLDVVLGDNFRYNFEYYIDKGHFWSFGVNSRYDRFHTGVSSAIFMEQVPGSPAEVNVIELNHRDYTNQLYAETLFQQIFSFGIGLEHKHLRVTSETIGIRPRSVSSSAVFDRSNYYSTYGSLKLDSFDNKYFPRKGIFFDGNFNLYLLSSGYNEGVPEFSIAKGSVGYAFPLNRNISARIFSGTGFTIGTGEPRMLNFFLGGYGNNLVNNFVPFYGYDFISLAADSYIQGLVELDYRFFNKNHIIASANFANVEDGLFSSGNWVSLPDYTGYALGYGAETFLGPVEIKYSYSPEVKRSQWFFSVGFWF